MINDNKKSKIGIVFFAAKWFEEVVLGKNKTTKVFNKFITEINEKIEIDSRLNFCN